MSISPTQFESLSSLLRKETAVVIATGKEYLIESRLSNVARMAGFSSVSCLIDHVLAHTTSELAQNVLLALTTHETSFFRDVAPFDALRNTILPTILERRKSSHSLTIWSAACSSGQEPYSIAMLLAESFPELEGWHVSLQASDINPVLLAHARDGLYSTLEVNRGLPARLLVKYFSQEEQGYRVKPVLRERVDFFERNLAKAWAPFQADIILLRNVLIYFDLHSRVKVLKAIHRTLAPDGYLIMGTAEGTRYLHSGFESAQIPGANVYIKV